MGVLRAWAVYPAMLVMASVAAAMAARPVHAQAAGGSRPRSIVGSGVTAVPTDWYVTPTGSDGNDCLSPGSPCATINAAIGKANSGDTVYVAVGSYTGEGEAVALLDKSLILSGGWDAAFAVQVGQSALDGEFTRTSLKTTIGITAFVECMRAHGGPAFPPGGILNAGTLSLSHCLVDGPFRFYAIGNAGTLTLESTTVRDNSDGAGIQSGDGSSLVLDDSVVTGNSVAGIRCSGFTTLSRSLVSENDGPGIDSAFGDVQIDRSTIEFNGGGILNFTGTLTVENSTIRGNSIFNFGGGIQNLSGNGRIGSTTLINTTVTGNSAVFRGGGVFNSGALIVNNSTITDNSTDGDGGGLFLNFNPGFSSLSLQNSIIAGNRAGLFSAPDVAGGFTTYPSGGYNLIGKLQNGPLVPAASDQVGLDPHLGPLQDNGGPTLTHALLPDSPAIDHGNPAVPGSEPGACEPTDQRGVARPVGLSCDIGAFEAPVFLVTNTDDSGPGSLRQAILDANAMLGPDSIRFAVLGAGPHVIAPLSPLPNLTDPVVIDGYSQPGSSPNTRPFGQGTDAVLEIVLDGGPGLSDPFFDALVVTGGNTTIRGLVIHRFGRIPIRLQSDANVIEGNFIGTDVTGSVGASNGLGVEVASSDNRIGGMEPASRNVIAFNNGDGIRVQSGAKRNRILGNFIGTDAQGTARLGNQFSGVELIGPGNEVCQNLISGNGRFAGAGITIFGPDAIVEANYIGTDVTGGLPIGNNAAGITIGSSVGTRIGSVYGGRGNVIAYNHDVFDQNGSGISVSPGTGGLARVCIAGNSIHSNAGLGIDLRPLGVNPNDDGDRDSGPNEGQNYPVLSSAEATGRTIKISGYLDSKPAATYRIEFFHNLGRDPTGHGEGEEYLGAVDITTNEAGRAPIKSAFTSFDEGHRIPPRGWITATATDLAGNTSEFSAGVAILRSHP